MLQNFLWDNFWFRACQTLFLFHLPPASQVRHQTTCSHCNSSCVPVPLCLTWVRQHVHKKRIPRSHSCIWRAGHDLPMHGKDCGGYYIHVSLTRLWADPKNAPGLSSDTWHWGNVTRGKYKCGETTVLTMSSQNIPRALILPETRDPVNMLLGPTQGCKRSWANAEPKVDAPKSGKSNLPEYTNLLEVMVLSSWISFSPREELILNSFSLGHIFLFSFLFSQWIL